MIAARWGKLQSRMVPHVCESTLGVAVGKVKHGLPHFTVRDFRRTAPPTWLPWALSRTWPNAA